MVKRTTPPLQPSGSIYGGDRTKGLVDLRAEIDAFEEEKTHFPCFKPNQSFLNFLPVIFRRKYERHSTLRS
jgi:hypothetical protein